MEGIEQIKKIAFLFKENRESQAFAAKILEFTVQKIKYEVVPFNMDNRPYFHVLASKLRSYDYVMVYKYDADFAELLEELFVTFKIFKPTLSNEFILKAKINKMLMENIIFDNSDETIIKTICKTLNLAESITHYFVEEGEIKSIVEPKKDYKYYVETPKEAAKIYIQKTEKLISTAELASIKYKVKLKKFKKKYKELLEK